MPSSRPTYKPQAGSANSLVLLKNSRGDPLHTQRTLLMQWLSQRLTTKRCKRTTTLKSRRLQRLKTSKPRPKIVFDNCKIASTLKRPSQLPCISSWEKSRINFRASGISSPRERLGLKYFDSASQKRRQELASCLLSWPSHSLTPTVLTSSLPACKNNRRCRRLAQKHILTDWRSAQDGQRRFLRSSSRSTRASLVCLSVSA